MPKIDFSILDPIEDKLARGRARKAIVAGNKTGKSPAEISADVKQALVDAEKWQDSYSEVLAAIETHLQNLEGSEAPATAKAPSAEVNEVPATAKSASPPPAEDVAKTPKVTKEKTPASVPTAKMDFSVLDAIDDKLAKGRARKAMVVGNKAGKSPADIAADVKQALVDAEKWQDSYSEILSAIEKQVQNMARSEANVAIPATEKAAKSKKTVKAAKAAKERPAKKDKPAKAPKPKADPRDKLAKPEGRPLIIDSSPHQHGKNSVPTVMWNVVLALAPITIFSVYLFGMAAVKLIIGCVLAAWLTEAIILRIRKQAQFLTDGSAIITGLLLALTLPPEFPLSQALIGVVFAIAVGKHIFGGLGYNIFNPALLGRAFLQANYPVAMTTWTQPRSAVDAMTTATPLGGFKFEGLETGFKDLFLGTTAGSLGESSALLILIGGVYLLFRGFADWRIPVSYLVSVFVFTAIFKFIDPGNPCPTFYLLSGGLMLGAFFMATDMVTSPITPLGSWIFGVGAGLILVIIRLFGGLPEGVMYSILLMNAITPLINRGTRPKYFGEVRK